MSEQDPLDISASSGTGGTDPLERAAAEGTPIVTDRQPSAGPEDEPVSEADSEYGAGGASGATGGSGSQ